MTGAQVSTQHAFYIETTLSMHARVHVQRARTVRTHVHAGVEIDAVGGPRTSERQLIEETLQGGLLRPASTMNS